jgi:hypothetical protein
MITRLVSVRYKTIIRISHRMIFIRKFMRDTPRFVPLLDFSDNRQSISNLPLKKKAKPSIIESPEAVLVLIGAKSKVGRTPASSLTDCQSNFHGILAPLPRKRRGMKVKLNSACDVTSSRLRAGALLECLRWVLICQGRLQHTLPPPTVARSE